MGSQAMDPTSFPGFSPTHPYGARENLVTRLPMDQYIELVCVASRVFSRAKGGNFEDVRAL